MVIPELSTLSPPFELGNPPDHVTPKVRLMIGLALTFRSHYERLGVERMTNNVKYCGNFTYAGGMPLLRQ